MLIRGGTCTTNYHSNQNVHSSRVAHKHTHTQRTFDKARRRGNIAISESYGVSYYFLTSTAFIHGLFCSSDLIKWKPMGADVKMQRFISLTRNLISNRDQKGALTLYDYVISIVYILTQRWWNISTILSCSILIGVWNYCRFIHISGEPLKYYFNTQQWNRRVWSAGQAIFVFYAP